MANRYWAAGVYGNWNSTSSWSSTADGLTVPASVPVSTDDVFLNANAGFVTVTLDISPDIQTLNCTGFLGSIDFVANTISLNGTGTIFTGATTMSAFGTRLIICTYGGALGRTINPTATLEFFASLSFRITAGTGTLSFGAGAIRDIDFTDGINPTGFGGNLNTFAITIWGSFKASTNMTASSSGNVMTFAATSGTKTITTAGVTFNRSFTFNGIGGTWQLQDALTTGNTRNVTLTNGTLDLNDQVLTIGLFSSSNSNTRSLIFGSTPFGVGKIVLTNVNATIFTTGTATGLTVAGSRKVEVTGVGAVGEVRVIQSGSIAAGGSAANAMNFYILAGADEIALGTIPRAIGDLYFNNFSGNTNANSAYQIYGSLTLSSTMTVSGSSDSWTFAGTGVRTITTNGVPLDVNIIFDGVGGDWYFTDALTQGSTRDVTFVNGTLRLKDGTTNTVGGFVTTGTSMKYLQSTIPGTQATISDTSGTNAVTYLTIQDSNATGGAYWDALDLTNVYGGNVTGWVFYYAVELGESTTGSDALVNNLGVNPAVQETATGSDAVLTQTGVKSAVQESATGSDAMSSKLAAICDMQETVIGSDVIVSKLAGLITVLESATGNDVILSKINGRITVVESAQGQDVILGRFLWELIEDNQPGNWQNIPTA